MGYAGYVPAKMPPAKPSATQAALWSIQNPETLELIAKLLKNVAVNPSEEKYRRIRLTNPKIKALVADEEGGLQAMLSLGWEQDPEDADALVVTKGRHFSMAEVRLVQDAEERLKKELRTAKRSTVAAKLPVNEQQARIRAALEADRLERSSRASHKSQLVAEAHQLP